ncbi:uncharacterized protein LOC122538176 [Frieseomelitta varia]|uniref:uncharacterized protein LOC122538176 n=1 Tax=Frieseomelitta varia TaxID=561572 RepID=UPI001CB6A8F6|nr:uncharacterized protein LOC122538176 [Frieseomelitta varia]
MDIIIQRTNEKVKQNMPPNKQWKPVDHTELNAFFGLVLLIGRFREWSFDSVQHILLWHNMYSGGVSSHMVNTIKKIYKKANTRIKSGTILTNEIDITRRVLPGNTLSSTLLSTMLYDIDKYFIQHDHTGVIKNMELLLFSDDLVIKANNLIDLQDKLKTLETYCRENKIEVNIEKTKILTCNRSGKETRYLKEVEKVQTKFFKRLLDVPKNTPNYIIRVEVGQNNKYEEQEIPQKMLGKTYKHGCKKQGLEKKLVFPVKSILEGYGCGDEIIDTVNLKYVNEEEIILNKIKERLFQNDKTRGENSAYSSIYQNKGSLRNKTGSIPENIYPNKIQENTRPIKIIRVYGEQEAVTDLR